MVLPTNAENKMKNSEVPKEIGTEEPVLLGLVTRTKARYIERVTQADSTRKNTGQDNAWKEERLLHMFSEFDNSCILGRNRMEA